MADELSERGYPDEALDYTRRALDLFPDHPEANLLAGRISLELKDRKSAGDFFRRYLQDHPRDPSEAESVKRRLREGR
jgi:tetratricopeptide (TPR) repeat protein